MAIGIHFTIMTLNAKGQNVPIKRHRVTDYIKKKTYNFCPQNTHFRVKHTYRQKVRGWANILHGKGNDKELE